MMILEFWPKGYAHETGVSRIEVPLGTTHAGAEEYVRKLAPYGELCALHPKRPEFYEPVDPKYAEMMSKFDNS